MTDNTLILQGDDFEDQTDLEGDIDTDANDFEDEYVDDAAAPDKVRSFRRPFHLG